MKQYQLTNAEYEILIHSGGKEYIENNLSGLLNKIKTVVESKMKDESGIEICAVGCLESMFSDVPFRYSNDREVLKIMINYLIQKSL